MPYRRCHHGNNQGAPCSCEMGNLYRFCEPIALICLARLGKAHGYQIMAEAERFAVTHAGLDSAAIYRALHRLEANGCAASAWETDSPGPARRVYAITPRGLEHLAEWSQVLHDVVGSLLTLARESARAAAPSAAHTPAPADEQGSAAHPTAR